MDKHIQSIESTINFLVEYKDILKNSEWDNNTKLEILLNNSNNYKEGYFNSLYSILDFNKNINMDNKLDIIVRDEKKTEDNIREVLPIILYYFALKEDFNHAPPGTLFPL